MTGWLTMNEKEVGAQNWRTEISAIIEANAIFMK
jgi:hypothetical protein